MNNLKLYAVAGLLLLLAAAFAEASENSGVWIFSVDEDSSSYASIALLQQESLTTIKDEYARQDLKPLLQFRCTPGKPVITAQINWRRFISSFSTELGFKIDGGKFTWLKWKVDQSNKVTLSPSVENSRRLIDLALAGEKLLVEVTPYSGSPITAEYDLAKFSGVLAQLQQGCNR